MNEIQQAAFELDLKKLRRLLVADHCHDGTLLAACSSHDPDPALQRQAIKLPDSHGVNVNETDKNGVRPLHRAARFRSPEAVRTLIELGADVNLLDKRSGASPLHRVVTNTGAPSTAGKTSEIKKIAKLLLENGADPNVRNKNGLRPKDYLKAGNADHCSE